MKPILFKTEMVRAILEGRKTVTRRVVKPRYGGNLEVHDDPFGTPRLSEKCGCLCRGLKPPYRPGDILYVRETWGLYHQEPGFYVYKADKYEGKEFDGFKWRPSIHMPREAARIFLRVKDVRVERLQDITPEQAMEEGVIDPNPARRPYILYEEVGQIELYAKNKVFPDIWDSAIKPADRAFYGWAANPWVWAIEFERCEKPEEDT